MGVIETEKRYAFMRGISWEILKASAVVSGIYGSVDYTLRNHFNLDARAPDAMDYVDTMAITSFGFVGLALLAWVLVRGAHNSYLGKHFEP